jgi:hypothetical protein
MLTEYVNSFVKLGIGAAFEPRLGDGRFTMINKTRAIVDMKGMKYSCGLELASNFQITGAKFRVSNPTPKSNFYGYNKRYIDEDGVYDPLRAIDEYSRTVPGMRLGRDELKALASTDNLVDSQEAFIYNMLVSWFKAKLYKDMSGKNGKFTVQHSSFKDSHVGFSMYGEYGERSVDINLGPPRADEDFSYAVEYRDSTNFWTRPYVIKYSSNSVDQTSFYIAHAAGADGNSGLSADIPIAPLDFDELLFDPIGLSPSAAIKLHGDYWQKPNVIWLWIMDYVRLNRVEQEFASALELLGSLATQPMPSYHESILWSKALTNVNLSKFSPTRARIPSNLVGEPNVHDLNASTFTFDESKSPSNFVSVSSILNYTFWLGMYGMVSNFSEDCADWTDAFVSTDAELGILNTVPARAAMISLVTGKETNSCFTDNCHITFDLSGMYGIKQMVVSEVVDNQHTGTVYFDAVPQYVSGSLLLGAVSSDYPVLHHLHPQQSFSADRNGLVTPEDAAKMANTYRLFGHHLNVEHFRSGELYPTYANSEDSVIAVYELFGRSRTFDIMRVTSSTVRQGRSSDLPDAAHIAQYGECHVSFDQPVIEVSAWKRRKMVHRPVMVVDSRRVATKFHVGATSGFEKTRFVSYNRTGTRRQDFHEAQPELMPAVPIVRGTAAHTIPLEAAQEVDPAEDVE